MNIRLLLSPISLLLIGMNIIFLSGCSTDEEKSGSKKSAPKVVNVRVMTAETMPMRPFIQAVGTLNPLEDVIISSELTGILKDMTAEEGTLVNEGDIIATIEQMDYLLGVKQAETALRHAQAELSHIRQEYKRTEDLFNNGIASSQQLEELSTKVELAEANVEMAHTSIDIARRRFSKTVIRSPITGVIKEKKVFPGTYLKDGTQLYAVVRTNPLKLSFSIPERETGRIKRGQEVEFITDAFPDIRFSGILKTIFPSLDSRTRTLLVEASVANHEGILKPGGFAQVSLYVGRETKMVVVPINSLLYEGSTIKVFIANGEVASERQVKVGQKKGEMIGIIEGVNEGELVIVAGQQNLFDGAKIKSQPASGGNS